MAPSLRAKLLRWLLVPLGVLWLADAVGTYLSTRRTVNGAYDRALYASVLAISEHVTLVDGRSDGRHPAGGARGARHRGPGSDLLQGGLPDRRRPGHLSHRLLRPAGFRPRRRRGRLRRRIDERRATATPEPASVVAAMRPPSSVPTFLDADYHGYPVPRRHLRHHLPDRAAHRRGGPGGRDAGRAQPARWE